MGLMTLSPMGLHGIPVIQSKTHRPLFSKVIPDKWLAAGLCLVAGLGLSLSPLAAPDASAKVHHSKASNKAHSGARKASSGVLTFDERYAALVMDASTGRVIHEHAPDELRYPASLTKMMTLYLTFEAMAQGKLNFQTVLSISGHAAEQGPTKLGLRPGQTLNVHEAVLALITLSANDAAVALAEAIGGSEERFAELMTRKAHYLGMAQTVYRNANGLPDPDMEQHTTARDQAKLALRLMRDFPDQYPLFSTQEFRFRGAVYGNHNHLLKQYAGTDGFKTGYINASGFNLVASARRDGHRLIGVVFGGPTSATRDRRMMQILDHGFATLEGNAGPLVAIHQIHNATAVRLAARTRDNDTEEGDSGDDAPAAAQPAPASTRLAQTKTAPKPQVVASVPQSLTAGDWAIQVGAFRTKNSAEQQIKLVRQAVPALASLKVAVLPDRAKKPRNHRAQLIGLSEKDAEAACQALTARDMPCLRVEPGASKRG
jgi:D-alanyl-D-alanine carboxypeptidase